MPLTPGSRLGDYEILGPLGSGGMGEVYRARDTQLQRDIALKVLPGPAVGDTAAHKRLLEEARTASALNHPHICTIHQVSDADGRLFIAMELIDGKPLAALVGGDGMPVSDVLRYGVQIADGLAHAHERGIVHCDLKCANVMIAPGGRAKILDFGLATRKKAECEEATLSRVEASTAAGTLAYMAPEVLRGDPADARSDIWALGVMLYEMASGEKPFGGRTGYELTSAIMKDIPAPLPASVAAPLQGVIAHCLSKEPNLRYQTAAEVRAALETATKSSAAAVTARMSTASATTPASGRRWAIAAVVVAILAAGAYLAYRKMTSAPTGPARIESIAVLPLDNFSKDPDQEFFADGMTEQLIADLSKLGSLRVISRTSVMQYKGKRAPLPQIARDLKVDAIIEGSVMRSGDRVRITAQLIQASTDKHLWADTYDRDLENVLGIQSEVARSVAEQVRITLTPQEQAKLGSQRRVDPEVFQLYLRGKYAVNRDSEEDQKKGVSYFEQAIAKDPNYAPAYAGLALAYGGIASIYAPPHEVMPKAKAAARKALELDEALSEAHTALAKVHLFYDWDWDGTEKELRRAIELNPSSVDAHHLYGRYFSYTSQREAAFREYKTAQALDPLSLSVAIDLLMEYILARKYDEAVEECKKAIVAHPNFAFGHAWLGLAYNMKKQYPEAIAEMEKARAIFPGPTMDHFLAVVLASSGDKAKAKRIATELEKAADRMYVCAYEVAEVHVLLGDNNAAAKWLERGRREQCDCMVGLTSEPWIDPYRADPRYTAMVKQVFRGH